MRSTTDLQVNRVLRALRKTSEMALCNHSATEIRASGWDEMGSDGNCWDGGERLTSSADVRFRKAQPEGITAPARAVPETSARGYYYARVLP